MSLELIGILGVGVTLAGIMLSSVRRIERRLHAVEQCLARIEGALDVLRDAVFGRSAVNA